MLANFVSKFTPESKIFVEVCQVMARRWCIYMDGASNRGGFGVGIVMISSKGVRLEKSLRLGFRASNNEAEYEALISGLKTAQQLGAEKVEIFSDSNLVVS